MQRVVAAMNQMDQKKHEKFANQFNYALNRKGVGECAVVPFDLQLTRIGG